MSKSLLNLIALIAPALTCAWSEMALSQSLPTSAGGVQISSAATPGTPLEGSKGYPRVIQLMDRLDTPKGRLLASSRDRLYTSDDDGATWRFAMTMPEVPGMEFRCCETLFQLPRPVGTLWAGTILYAASYLRGSTPTIGFRSMALSPFGS
jgi:hypothetical protein